MSSMLDCSTTRIQVFYIKAAEVRQSGIFFRTHICTTITNPVGLWND